MYDENEENKEKNNCPLIFCNQKDQLWVVIMDDDRSDLDKIYSIDPSYNKGIDDIVIM